MENTSINQKECAKRIILSRFRILKKYPFFGLLLMRAKFGLADCETAYTDGRGIYFSPIYLKELSDDELDFIMLHEIMHIALRHCSRGLDYNHEIFNYACDIVVNSNIAQMAGGNEFITLKKYGVSMHLAPNGEEGYKYTVEEVYNMFKDKDKIKKFIKSFDNHEKWSKEAEDEWVNAVAEAYHSYKEHSKDGSGGEPPPVIRKMMDEYFKPQVDWRLILSEFVQFDIKDYDFTPPDYRYNGDFFLPSYQDKEETINLLVMVDTSGSISDQQISLAFSEIRNVINSFNGKMEGTLCFFDTRVYQPIPFSNVKDLKNIKPEGGGGTCFDVIFESLPKLEKEINNKIDALIIFTDGYADFPDQSVAGTLPVLWIINDTNVTPPWGVTARISINN